MNVCVVCGRVSECVCACVCVRLSECVLRVGVFKKCIRKGVGVRKVFIRCIRKGGWCEKGI